MKSGEYKLVNNEGLELQVYEWLPDNQSSIKGVIQIAHGMAEHSGRYADFAAFLVSNQYGVYSLDHRGHGKTAGSVEKLGFIAKANGWNKLVDDFRALSFHIREKHADIPLYLFGHSMGSFVVRSMLVEPGIKLNGAIISGTAGNPGILGYIGIFLTRFLILFFPENSPSKFMDNLSFGAYNKPFKPNRTKFDWLSRDNEQVDKYVSDPFCGTVFSLKFFNDLLNGLIFINKQANINKVSPDIPVLFFAGDKDPVGNNGRGVLEVYQNFKKAGIKNVTAKLFTDGRHESLNETNRQEVFQFVLDWLKKN